MNVIKTLCLVTMASVLLVSHSWAGVTLGLGMDNRLRESIGGTVYDIEAGYRLEKNYLNTEAFWRGSVTGDLLFEEGDNTGAFFLNVDFGIDLSEEWIIYLGLGQGYMLEPSAIGGMVSDWPNQVSIGIGYQRFEVLLRHVSSLWSNHDNGFNLLMIKYEF